MDELGIKNSDKEKDFSLHRLPFRDLFKSLSILKIHWNKC